MKNALFWALGAVVAVILGLFGYGVYLSVTHASSGFDPVAATCTGFILVVSLVAWELLMKPGYYRRRADESKAEVEPDDEGGPTPPSSR
jgi:hypothetical protein